MLKEVELHNKPIEESIIIRRILNGEKELYELLVRRNNQKLYRIIRSYLKDENEVEDAMQEAYLKAYEKLYQFRLDSSFSTWLIRIGINVSLARLREKARFSRSPEQTDEDYSQSIQRLPDNNQINPQRNMIRKETKQILEDAIDQLDSKYRAVYVLKEVEGMSVKGVAQIMDLTESNVKVRVHRARAMLKEILLGLSSGENVFEFGFGRCDRMTEQVMEKILS